MANKKYTIVVAWAAKTGMRQTGRHVQRDRNWFLEYEFCWLGSAAVWLNEGTRADIQKARAHAAKMNEEYGFCRERLGTQYHVFVYETTEEEPLKRARGEVVERAEKREHAQQKAAQKSHRAHSNRPARV